MTSHAVEDAQVRRILCVFPRYEPSFGTFQYAYSLTKKFRAFMPPQGLLLVAAVLPGHWEVRFIDENMVATAPADFAWADAVFVSGMHIQRRQINDVCRRAHEYNRTAVLGGSSVSACEHWYPEFDYLHIGELGDATDELIERLARDPTRPRQQIILRTSKRRDMVDFPVPRYSLAAIDQYFLANVQFSSGCPYQCEFCDIPGLYGRTPRLKSSEQVLAELDALKAQGCVGGLYFVDDNFIAHRRAVRDLLPQLIAWQRRNGYVFDFSCEATLNIAKRPELLELMREAGFTHVFCGIETPDAAALRAISKQHNVMVPILEAVQTLNSYGLEVVSGIILGLDTDTPETGASILDFINRSQIPMLTINLLQALPRTPLWDRLQREGRLLAAEDRESNVVFRLPYNQVLAMWRDCMAQAYQPAALFRRYRHQVAATYPNRLKRPISRERLAWRNLRLGFSLLGAVLWHVGVRSDYRQEFWKFAGPRLLRGDMQSVIAIGLVAHHLITFARQAVSGRHNASHYSAKLQEAA